MLWFRKSDHPRRLRLKSSAVLDHIRWLESRIEAADRAYAELEEQFNALAERYLESYAVPTARTEMEAVDVAAYEPLPHATRRDIQATIRAVRSSLRTHLAARTAHG